MTTTFEMRRPPSGQTDEQGKTVELQPVLYVRIERNEKEVIHRPATDDDKTRWPDEYAAYEASQKAGKSKAEAKSDAKDAKADAKAEAKAEKDADAPKHDGKHEAHKTSHSHK